MEEIEIENQEGEDGNEMHGRAQERILFSKWKDGTRSTIQLFNLSLTPSLSQQALDTTVCRIKCIQLSNEEVRRD